MFAEAGFVIVNWLITGLPTALGDTGQLAPVRHLAQADPA
jgi:hypothetical protein